MWRNFGKNLEILEKFWEILENFGRFCHNLRAFMWRNIEPKKYICGEKMTNLRPVMMVVMVVMMTLKMILGSSWVSEKEEDNKALSVVEYSYNRQKKKALVKTLKRHERHVPSC